MAVIRVGRLVVFTAFLLVGLAIRACLHAVYEFMNHGLVHEVDEGALSRATLLAYSRPWLRFGAGSLGATAVLSLASSSVGGTPSPAELSRRLARRVLTVLDGLGGVDGQPAGHGRNVPPQGLLPGKGDSGWAAPKPKGHPCSSH